VTDLLNESTDQPSAHYQYDPFGRRLAATGPLAEQPYQWSTKEHHASSGLVYYLYRFYDAENGRWVNRDPIGELGGVNLYGFVGNYTLGFVDGLGLKANLDCIRCLNDPRGPISCVLTRSDGSTSRFMTNDPGNPAHLGNTHGPIDINRNGVIENDERDLPYNYPRHSSSDPYGRYGPIPPGEYTVSPRTNAVDESRYGNGTPTINTPGQTNGTIIGGDRNSGNTTRWNVFMHGCGWSDGCMTTPDRNVRDVENELKNGNIPMTLREICCDDGQMPPVATPVTPRGSNTGPLEWIRNLFR